MEKMESRFSVLPTAWLSEEAEIRSRLSAGSLDADTKSELRVLITELFRKAETAEKEILGFKDSVRALATLWKGESGGRLGSSSVMHDHLGASTWIEKGWSRISMGDSGSAEEALKRALELSPGDNNAEALLGWAQMLAGRDDEALLTLLNVLFREPSNELSRTIIAYIFLRKGRHTEAIGHLAGVIRGGKDNKAVLYAHLYMGLVYFDRGAFEDANLLFEKAISLGPNLIQAHYNLGRSYWFSGDKEMAKTVWRRGVEANRFNLWGKHCAELLELVESGGTPPSGV